MKRLIAVILLSVSVLAAKYPAGAVCRTNVECDANCINKQWTVADRDDSYVLVCDPNVADPAEYFVGQCRSRPEGFPILTPRSYDAGKTASACAKLGGQSCPKGRVISTTKSAYTDNYSSWQKACLDLGAQGSGFTEETKEEADLLAGCDA